MQTWLECGSFVRFLEGEVTHRHHQREDLFHVGQTHTQPLTQLVIWLFALQLLCIVPLWRLLHGPQPEKQISSVIYLNTKKLGLGQYLLLSTLIYPIK